MDRRAFLRGASLITAGIVAADQLALLEKLTWTRTMFPSAEIVAAPGLPITQSELDALLKQAYSEVRLGLANSITPIIDAALIRRGPKSLFTPEWGGNNLYWDVVVQRDSHCPPGVAFGRLLS